MHLVGRDTGEADVLSRLERRIATANTSMAATDPVPEFIADSNTGSIEDARAEATRLVTARTLTFPDDAAALTALDGGRWWTVRARGITRRRLEGRGFLFYRARLIDGTSGVAASHLIALSQLPFIGTTSDHPVLRDAVAKWAAACTSLDDAFWRTRIAREEWILATAEVDDPAAYQAGLFDRRTERRRAADRASREAFRDLVNARLAEARRRSTISRRDVDLMLVIHP
jgi:hypothetical protein